MTAVIVILTVFGVGCLIVGAAYVAGPLLRYLDNVPAARCRETIDPTGAELGLADGDAVPAGHERCRMVTAHKGMHGTPDGLTSWSTGNNPRRVHPRAERTS